MHLFQGAHLISCIYLCKYEVGYPIECPKSYDFSLQDHVVGTNYDLCYMDLALGVCTMYILVCVQCTYFGFTHLISRKRRNGNTFTFLNINLV